MANRRPQLAAARDQRGHTQESLARALGVEPSTVARWERGAGTPRPGARTRLAAELGVDLDELNGLLAGDDPGETAPAPPTSRAVGALNVVGQADAASAVDALGDLVEHYAHSAADPARNYDELLQVRRHAGELAGGLAGPRQMDLAATTGWLSTLLAMAASGAGDTAAAVVWCRDAERHGSTVGHPEIVGWSEMTRAVIAYYQGAVSRAAAIAERGLAAVPYGTVVHARLAAQEMRSRAALGDAEGMAQARRRADAAVAALPEGYAGTGAFSIHLTADGPPYVATSLLLTGNADDAAAATQRVLRTSTPGPSRARALLILALAEAGRGRADAAAEAGTAALTTVPPAWATMALARRLDGALAAFAGAGEVSSYRALYRDEVQRASTPSLPPGGPDGR